MSERSMLLEYRYAIINLETGECLACMTFSYEIINDAYIPVPHGDNSYRHSFYNQQDGLWYTDGTFTVLAEGLN